MNINRLEIIGSWKLVLNKARRTIGKDPIEKEPSDEWKAKMLLAEHSPIRLIQYDWTWLSIKQWVTTHLVRHHIGVEKFVRTQRTDRTGVDRDELKQSSLNDMDMTANAQALINISRKRLCNCASLETRQAWKLVVEKIKEVDPIMAEKMVPECIYRGFCPEFIGNCGYSKTKDYEKSLLVYRNTSYKEGGNHGL